MEDFSKAATRSKLLSTPLEGYQATKSGLIEIEELAI